MLFTIASENNASSSLCTDGASSMRDCAHGTTGPEIGELRLPLQLGTGGDHSPASIQSHTLKDACMRKDCLKHCKTCVTGEGSREKSAGQLLLIHAHSACTHKAGDKSLHPVTEVSALQRW